MTLRVYFLRHGQTAMSRANHFCGCGSDPELTADGQEMAECFAQYYHNFAWSAVYVSPLQRAVTTAAPLLKKIELSCERRKELVEIDYGRWEGRTVTEIQAEYPGDYSSWCADPEKYAPTGGETARQIAGRVGKIIDEVRASYSEGNILIISHKATIRIALCSLMGIDLSLFRYRLACPVASLSMVEFGEQGALLHFLADRAHLNQRLRDLPGT